MSKNNLFPILSVGLIILVGYFIRIVTAPLYYDENMYVTAAYFLEYANIYEDYAYLQMPYLPYIYMFVNKLFGGNYYFLSARLLNLLFVSIACIAIYLILYRITKDKITSAVTTLLFSLNGIVIWVSGFAWNALAPVPFALFSFYFFTKTSYSISNYNKFYSLLAGFTAALATGIKLFYIFLIIAYIFWLLYSLKKNGTGITLNCYALPYSIGFIVGVGPVIIIAMGIWDVFLFNNIVYHELNYLWREATGFEQGMNIISKIQYMMNALFSLEFVIIFVLYITILTCSFLSKKLRSLLSINKSMRLHLSLLLGVAIIVSLYPTPSWSHYLIVPIPYFYIHFGLLLYAVKNITKYSLIIISVVTILTFYYGWGNMVYNIGNISSFNNWTPVKLHNESWHLREKVASRTPGKKVATLHPILAIESGLDIYPELATGPFLYRVGDYLSKSERNKYIATSCSSILELFEDNPPTAFITGLDRKLENPFYHYIDAYHYKEIETQLFGIKMYQRYE